MKERTLERSRDLARELIVRSIRLRYRRSFLGLAWAQLGPIFMMVILSVVFTRVIPLGIENYPVFLFIGLTSWQWFQGGITSATASVVTNRDLVRQPGFPIPLLPPAEVASQFVHYLLALPVVLAAVAFTSGLPLTAIGLPAVLLVQFVLCVGCGYFLAALHVAVRDTSQVVGIVLRLLFYATPIMYDEARLVGTSLEVLFDLNPLAHLIAAQRDLLLYGRWPSAYALTLIAAVGTLLTVWGRRVFSAATPRFVDEV